MIHSDEKWEQLLAEKSNARWGVLCGMRSTTKGVEEAQNEKEERQV